VVSAGSEKLVGEYWVCTGPGERCGQISTHVNDYIEKSYSHGDDTLGFLTGSYGILALKDAIKSSGELQSVITMNLTLPSTEAPALPSQPGSTPHLTIYSPPLLSASWLILPHRYSHRSVSISQAVQLSSSSPSSFSNASLEIFSQQRQSLLGGRNALLRLQISSYESHHTKESPLHATHFPTVRIFSTKCRAGNAGNTAFRMGETRQCWNSYETILIVWRGKWLMKSSPCDPDPE